MKDFNTLTFATKVVPTFFGTTNLITAKPMPERRPHHCNALRSRVFTAIICKAGNIIIIHLRADETIKKMLIDWKKAEVFGMVMHETYIYRNI